MSKKCIKEFMDGLSTLEIVRDHRKNLLRMDHYSEKIPKNIIQLTSELECTLRKFQDYCFNEKVKANVKAIKDHLVYKYNLSFEYSGFYYRELDPLSKKFSGDYESVLLLRFQNALYEFYCDYFLLTDDAKGFKDAVIKHSLLLSDTYVMRSFYILLEAYGQCLPLTTLACHLINPVESVFDKEKVTNIKQLKISKALKNLMSKKSIKLSSSFLFEVVIESINTWERKNKNWSKKYIQDDPQWKFYSKYENESDCWCVGGLFNLGGWNNGIDFPEGHRFYKNKLPVLKYLGEYSTIRPDCLLGILGEKIDFSSIVENNVRDKLELPRLGEGQWFGEISLLNRIKSLTSEEVIHQWSPNWLGRQRIDIAIPSLNLAFEYNGQQHYMPVDFFGGKDAYSATLKRDEMKRRKCKENNIKLIEIKYDSSEDEVGELLHRILRKKKIA
jgi:hypothetical protein